MPVYKKSHGYVGQVIPHSNYFRVKLIGKKISQPFSSYSSELCGYKEIHVTIPTTKDFMSDTSQLTRFPHVTFQEHNTQPTYLKHTYFDIKKIKLVLKKVGSNPSSNDSLTSNEKKIATAMISMGCKVGHIYLKTEYSTQLELT